MAARGSGKVTPCDASFCSTVPAIFRPRMNALFRYRSGTVRHIVSRITLPHASEGQLRRKREVRWQNRPFS
jgi:hypothetical protein